MPGALALPRAGAATWQRWEGVTLTKRPKICSSPILLPTCDELRVSRGMHVCCQVWESVSQSPEGPEGEGAVWWLRADVSWQTLAARWKRDVRRRSLPKCLLSAILPPPLHLQLRFTFTSHLDTLLHPSSSDHEPAAPVLLHSRELDLCVFQADSRTSSRPRQRELIRNCPELTAGRRSAPRTSASRSRPTPTSSPRRHRPQSAGGTLSVS